MSLLGKLASDGITAALGIAIKASPVDAEKIALALTITGSALQDLGGKLADGKISEEEIEDSLNKVGALGDDPVALAAKAAIGRLIEQIL
jgi:hypothetical protein